MLAKFLAMGSDRQQIILTISSNQNNYDVYTNRGASYVAGKSDITVVVNSGKVVGSTSTSTYAMTVSTSFHADDTVTIVNNGSILGRGGLGGSGGNIVQTNGAQSPQDGVGGLDGGPALRLQRAAYIQNNGVIGGGGGGGGGGASVGRATTPWDCAGGSGGGSGQGGGADAGGAAGIATSGGYTGTVSSGNAGSAGSSASNGAGGPAVTAGSVTGGAGAAGGSLGTSGSTGGMGTGGATNSGGPGGSAGICVQGNSYATWLATGTRYGVLTG